MNNLPHTLNAEGLSVLLYKSVATILRDVTRDKNHKRQPPHFKIGKKPLWITQVVLDWIADKSSVPVTIKIEFSSASKQIPGKSLPQVRSLTDDLMTASCCKTGGTVK